MSVPVDMQSLPAEIFEGILSNVVESVHPGRTRMDCVEVDARLWIVSARCAGLSRDCGRA